VQKTKNTHNNTIKKFLEKTHYLHLNKNGLAYKKEMTNRPV